MTKKVLLIIVEGQTEQIILEDYLDAYFENATIRFDVQREVVLLHQNASKSMRKLSKNCFILRKPF